MSHRYTPTQEIGWIVHARLCFVGSEPLTKRSCIWNQSGYVFCVISEMLAAERVLTKLLGMSNSNS